MAVEPPYRKKNMMPGMIMMWHGSVATIPSGWHLCDGAAGTIDLRNKFLVGAGDAYNPADAGGAINHGHAFTGDGHVHGIPNTLACPGAAANLCLNGTDTESAAAAGTTNNADGRPPYYALCFIQKIN